MKPAAKPFFFVCITPIAVVLAACSGLPRTGGGGGTGGGGSTFTIGGTVTGLTGTGLVLQNNAGDDLAISASGSFTFKTAIAKGGAYNVTVSAQPSNPAQTCTVTNPSGTANANVTNVQVTCQTSPITIGGTVIGLTGTGLVLQNNGGDDLTITKSGAFTFKTALASGATYKVTIKTQPSSPTQTCSVTSGSGTALSSVTNVQVTCGNIFTIGGSVSGLLGSGLVLQDNGVDNLTVTGTGSVNFTFATTLSAGATYSVTVLTQPANPGQTCSVVNGSGTTNTSITTVQVICSQPAFTIGGSVVGLVPGTGNTVELQDNAGDDLFVTGNASFTFPTPVTNGGIYNVSVFLQPTSQPQPCNMFNYTGIAKANVSDVLVDCQHNDWNWISWYISDTAKANNYAKAVNPIPVKDINTPGGRDFAATWSSPGKKWLFGGFGFPAISPFGAQPTGFLNDLWFWDGVWNPVNVGPASNGTWPLLEATNVNGIYGHAGCC